MLLALASCLVISLIPMITSGQALQDTAVPVLAASALPVRAAVWAKMALVAQERL
jgi:hypothetical protein